MKHLLLLLLFVPVFSFAQTKLERRTISKSTPIEKVQELFQSNLRYKTIQDSLKQIYISKHNLTQDQVKKIKLIYNGIPVYYKEDNSGAARTIGANKLYPGGSLGLSVTGSGMTAGEWDGGKVRSTHQELNGRVTLSDAASTLSEHSTHVAGTIIAGGFQTNAKGMAYQANLKSYDWTSDTDEITTFANNGFLVSNHSYGYDAANLPEYTFGKYNSDAVILDNISYTYPYYLMCKAAGNDRGDTTIPQAVAKGGYDLLTGECNSKNVISVAAVNEITIYTDSNDVIMSSFSNFGPTDDGRVKPDISAKGVNTYSCISTNNTSYSTFSGTSMASPSVTGLIILLQKHYNNLNTGTFMKSATVRGLLAHSAREAGSDAGPDYSFGWGLANGLEAATIISNKGTTSVLDEKTLIDGNTYNQNLILNSNQDLKITISWTDPPGPVNSNTIDDDRTPELVNNLDLKILKDGVFYYPWKLDPDNPSNAATNFTENNIDNIEKIDIPNATAGVYSILISHKGTLFNGSQDYTLIASGTVGVSLNTKDFDYDNRIFVYPNPAKSVLNFSVKDNFVFSSIEINDISGKVVYRNTSFLEATNSIDISAFSSGVYFVTFKSDTNSVSKKFIKE